MVRYVDDTSKNVPDKDIDSTQADKSRNDHLYSDVDTSQNAQHHTLGKQPTQAAAGNHRHDGDYSTLSHGHTSDDLPEIVIPDEVIVSPTDPLLDDPDLPDGTLWVDSSIPDANIQVINADWESDPVNITSTTFAHPSKWGSVYFTAPDDGSMLVQCFVDFDNSGLLNNRSAEWRMRLYDSTGTLVKGKQVTDDRTRVFSLFNHFTAPVLQGETYRLALEFALSHANGTTFTVSDAKASLLYIPRADYIDLVIETDP